MVTVSDSTEQNRSVEQTTLLTMQNISKEFSGVPVLRDVCFELIGGQVHILAGENGAGKSTLIKILAGVHTDYTGQILINGSPARLNSVTDAARRGIAVIHQELSLVGAMSVAENIFLGREKSRFGWLNAAAMKARAAALLAEMGLEVDPGRPVDSYPISVRQMIEICKALAFESRIIVMDEPTSALTEPEVEKLFAIIDKLRTRGCGIIYISHKMEEIFRIADAITVLRDGEYIGSAPAAEMNPDKLVTWMIGRELNQQFPRHVSRRGDVRLRARNFTVPDRGGKPYPAVNSVSFEVRAGEILGLAGLQGSGSSELLNGLFGTYGSGVTGTVTVDGRPFTPGSPAAAIRSGMALLTNDRKSTGLVLSMNIFQNATLASLGDFSPGLWLRPKRELRAVHETAQALRLKAHSLDSPVTSLSGGNQQKVVISKWIHTRPRVLLLDEPTRGVDVGAKHEIYELMNQWTAEGIAIVLITSEMPELLAMSDRIAVMHRGGITAELTAADATQEKILSAAMGENHA